MDGFRERDKVRVCTSLGRDFLQRDDDVDEGILLKEMSLLVLGLCCDPFQEGFDGLGHRLTGGQGRR